MLVDQTTHWQTQMTVIAYLLSHVSFGVNKLLDQQLGVHQAPVPLVSHALYPDCLGLLHDLMIEL